MDSFNGGATWFSGPTACTSGSATVRNYTLNLTSRSIVTANLLVGISSGSGSYACIEYAGLPCGYTWNPSAGGAASTSSSCQVALPAGTYSLRFSGPSNSISSFNGFLSITPY